MQWFSSLYKGSSDKSRLRKVQKVARWWVEDEYSGPLQNAYDRVEHLFDSEEVAFKSIRTEITRVQVFKNWNEAKQLGWGVIWRTRNDSLVCDYCASMHQQPVDSRADLPPAGCTSSQGCRCGVATVAEEPEEIDFD